MIIESPNTSMIMVKKAVRMSGNALDMIEPSPHFKWRACAEAMFKSWEREGVDFQDILQHEKEIFPFCMSNLVDFTDYMTGVGR